METASFAQIHALFLELIEIPENERLPYLGRMSVAAEIRAVLSAMLKHDAQADGILDSGLATIASQILDDEGLTAVGRRLGPYQLQHRIGEGGMGVVYRARREDLDTTVAIKILPAGWLSATRRERFHAERRILAKLNHPNITRIYDADTEPDGTPWFAMELIQGVEITEYCRRNACSVDERLRLFRATCCAVQFAHEHAIIHRDLKPSNILVTNQREVKLLDFGIARQTDPDDRLEYQTLTGSQLMTPAYAAPEQVRNEPVGVFTDVYALGVILYELLIGRLPFDLEAKTPGEAERIIVESSPEKLSEVARRASLREKAAWKDLDILCLTSIQKEPSRRYRSVDALIRDVDHYLNGAPLDARPDSLTYRLGKFVSRNRRAVGSVSLVVAVFAILVVTYALSLARAHNAAVLAETREQRVQQFMLNLFEGGDPQAGPAKGLQVATLIDRGVKEAQSLKNEPRVQAELYRTLGNTYGKLGDLDKADRLLGFSLEEQRSLSGSSSLDFALTQIDVGLLRIDQARLAEAEDLLRRSLDTVRRIGDQDAVAKAAAALGKALGARGQYDQAISVLEEAVRLRSRPGTPTLSLAETLKELADTHFYAGHLDLCEALTNRSLEIHREIVGDRHPLVAEDLINIGAVQFERGRYGESESYYRQALAIDEAWYDKDHPVTASTLSMLSRSLVFQKHYNEGVSIAEKALVIQQRVYGADSPHVANILSDLGTVALQRNQYEEAASRFRRMADIYRKVNSEHHDRYFLALSNLASVELARKNYEVAESLYRQVLQGYSERLSPTDRNIAVVKIKLGRTLIGENRFSEAEKYTLAGYNLLATQMSPTASWLQSARKDLVAIYDSLHDPKKAALYR